MWLLLRKNNKVGRKMFLNQLSRLEPRKGQMRRSQEKARWRNRELTALCPLGLLARSKSV